MQQTHLSRLVLRGFLYLVFDNFPFLVVNAGKVLFTKLCQLRCIAGLLDQLLALH
jgi:hypothetical protein